MWRDILCIALYEKLMILLQNIEYKNSSNKL